MAIAAPAYELGTRKPAMGLGRVKTLGSDLPGCAVSWRGSIAFVRRVVAPGSVCPFFCFELPKRGGNRVLGGR